MLYANTVSSNPTHFLAALDLIKKAREDFKVPSENWPYPTDLKFGSPNDNYYAEVWSDGMDWQISYWIIEEYQLNPPCINPLIIFEHNLNREKFNEYDFKQLINAILYYRRDECWIDRGDLSYYTDTVWPHFHIVPESEKPKNKQNCRYCYFEHASQQRVYFWMNETYIPSEYVLKSWYDDRISISGFKKLSK